MNPQQGCGAPGCAFYLASTLQANRIPVFLVQTHKPKINTRYMSVKVKPAVVPECQKVKADDGRNKIIEMAKTSRKSNQRPCEFRITSSDCFSLYILYHNAFCSVGDVGGSPYCLTIFARDILLSLAHNSVKARLPGRG